MQENSASTESSSHGSIIPLCPGSMDTSNENCSIGFSETLRLNRTPFPRVLPTPELARSVHDLSAAFPVVHTYMNPYRKLTTSGQSMTNTIEVSQRSEDRKSISTRCEEEEVLFSYSGWNFIVDGTTPDSPGGAKAIYRIRFFDGYSTVSLEKSVQQIQQFLFHLTEETPYLAFPSYANLGKSAGFSDGHIQWVLTTALRLCQRYEFYSPSLILFVHRGGNNASLTAIQTLKKNMNLFSRITKGVTRPPPVTPAQSTFTPTVDPEVLTRLTTLARKSTEIAKEYSFACSTVETIEALVQHLRNFHVHHSSAIGELSRGVALATRVVQENGGLKGKPVCTTSTQNVDGIDSNNAQATNQKMHLRSEGKTLANVDQASLHLYIAQHNLVTIHDYLIRLASVQQKLSDTEASLTSELVRKGTVASVERIEKAMRKMGRILEAQALSRLLVSRELERVKSDMYQHIRFAMKYFVANQMLGCATSPRNSLMDVSRLSTTESAGVS